MFSVQEIRKNNRARLLISSFAARINAIAVILIMVLGSSSALAGRPPAPKNFRVTATTAYTVSLAWDPAPHNSGEFNYHLWGGPNIDSPVILPKTATSHTFTALYPSNTYRFSIYAKNAAGQASAQVNIGGIVLPRDITPPTTAPIVSFDEIGANYANLSWIPAQDDGPHLSTQIYLDGVLYAGVGRGITNTTLRFLQPDTTYSLTARAIDFGNNIGPFSDPIALVTPPRNPNDQTPPTTPTNLAAFGYGDREFQLWWTQSSDDFDAQVNIRYDVYVNGVLEEIYFGVGFISSIYGEFGENLVEIFATDTAGNTSAPATVTITL